MTPIDQIVQQVQQSTDFQINRKILHEKMQISLHFAHNGGLFKATPDLIAFVHAWRSTDEVWPWDGGDSMHLVDTYNNPIHIDNCAEFYRIACEHYQQVMNDWHQQHEELKRVRKI